MSNIPEFEGAPMTKREVLIARDAFSRGALWGDECWPIVKTDADGEAAERYPLRKVTRPRVVRLHPQSPYYAFRFRVVGGKIEWANLSTDDWTEYGDIEEECHNAEFLRALADLLANPTEECDADE